MRILIVDENADFSAVLREYLREGLSLAALKSARGGPPKSLAVKEWRPSTKGVPVEGKNAFKWNFDVLLINAQADSAATLEWITQARTSAGACWPAVLLLVGGADEKTLVAEALKRGVTECVPRLRLTPRSLYEALTAIVSRRDASAQAQSPVVAAVPPVRRALR
jgi:DNA-binding response OmpR family regulator